MNQLNLSKPAAKRLLTELDSGILLITMNRSAQLNGWTLEMMEALAEAFSSANINDAVKAVILTGSGEYYSAGANLGGSMQLMPPAKLHEFIVTRNQALFDNFLDCKKPLLIAVNGPALGATVTSATLANGVIASDKATFSTPFAALGITPEGCSSVHFARLMGEQTAQRMLGKEGWQPTAPQALEAGLIQWVVPHEQLISEAKRIAAEWIESGETRKFLGGSQLEELKAVNARESKELADAFLGSAFLKGQAQFLWSKKKRVPAAMFASLWALRPLWSKLV